MDLGKSAAELGLVIATHNYRNGIFGFLGGRQIRTHSSDGSTGNAGFLDQRMVLQWVKTNIEAFHGDPSRVLLIGANTGASHVSAHMVSPGSQGLFQRAMMMSGAFR